MFKEILQIVPQLSSTDLNNMEKSLSSRFKNIASKFGKGLVATLTGGGIAGLALGLVDKLLNPLKEVQDAIDKTLHHGGELANQAKQFNTSAGELAKLHGFAQAKGLEPEMIDRLVEKFQVAVSEAVADPHKETSVRNFVGQKDTAQGFFDFIQGLQKLNKNQQLQVQQEVFGEKQIGRMAEFMNADFGELSKKFSGISAARITKDVSKVDNLDELNKTLTAVRDLKDFNDKAEAINRNMIVMRNDQEKRKLEIETKQVKSYESLANIEAASTEVLNTIKSGILTLTNLLVKVTHLTENVKKVTGSRWVRGLLGMGSDDK